MKTYELIAEGDENHRDTPSPLPVVSARVLANLASYTEEINMEDGVIETVPINKIFGTEDYIDGEWADALATGEAHSEGLPLIMNLRGQYILLDGNHKVTAAIMRHQQDVDAIVFTV